MTTNFDRPLVWIDLETTGIDVAKHSIMEIACIITDGQLENQVIGPHLIINLPDDVLLKMDDWCWKQHGKTGLTQKCREKTAFKINDAEDIVLSFVKKYVPDKKTGLLAGSSVHFDKEFIRKQMPRLYEYLHYRLIDVSTIGELVRRWYPDVLKGRPKKTGNHRAMDDIQDSLKELQFYKAMVFRNPLENTKENKDNDMTDITTSDE